MREEDKELLLKDLCARLPYDVKMEYCGKAYSIFSRPFKSVICLINGAGQVSTSLSKCKPYLRPMSDITTDEKMEWFNMRQNHCGMSGFNAIQERADFTSESLDWLNEHHFDYRGLIEKGLALEAPEGMYNN